MKLKSTCCEKYRRKGKACSRCPTLACMSKKKRKKLISKCRKNLSKAA